jgi:structural maintenance of chromosome 2
MSSAWKIDCFLVIIMQTRNEEIEAVRKLKADVSSLAGELNGVQFSYNNPSRDFDRSRVKGVVARLLKVKDPSTMTALEVNFLELCCEL